ncbi:hypothetical protein H4R35_000275 [Dimargaris xerosporica]|nr:hypothetical protein H4R35_000275 [Dimargaris xerosporica]
MPPTGAHTSRSRAGSAARSWDDQYVLYHSPVDDPALSAAIDEALADLKPDHYYHNSGVPVFTPTLLQFRDFSRFIAAAEPFAKQAGLCKVVPPAVWHDQLYARIRAQKGVTGDASTSAAPSQAIYLDNDAFPIMRPIVQHFEGSKGIYKQYNIEHRRKLNLTRFYDQALESAQAIPGAGKTGTRPSPPASRRKSASTSLSPKAPSPELHNHPASSPPVGSAELANGIFVELAEGVIRSADPQKPATHGLPLLDSAPSSTEALAGDAKATDRSYGTISIPTTDPRYLAHFDHLDRQYWRNITFEPPLYGADVPGTLFPTASEFPTWNPRDLGTVLNRIDVPMSGVNQPYLYLGMWKATFAWHLEDMDLYSINYLHFGRPKSWYCIPPAHQARFERAAQSIFSNDARACQQFLRHKAYMVSPSVLTKQYDVPVYRLVQTRGEFVITFPYGYHAGFNQGFNCAESVNFALPSWAELGKRALPCQCIRDSVRIAVEEFFPNELTEADYWQELRQGRFECLWDRRALTKAKEEAAQGSTDVQAAGEPSGPTKRRRTESSDGSATMHSRPTRPTHLAIKAHTAESIKPHDLTPSSKGSLATALTMHLHAKLEKTKSKIFEWPSLPSRCAACLKLLNGDTTATRQCADCHLTVHQACYPIFDIGASSALVSSPTTPWCCLRCQVKASALPCYICAYFNGPLLLVNPYESVGRLSDSVANQDNPEFLAKFRRLSFIRKTKSLKFAHPLCARLVPQTRLKTTLGDLLPVPVQAIYRVALLPLAAGEDVQQLVSPLLPSSSPAMSTRSNSRWRRQSSTGSNSHPDGTDSDGGRHNAKSWAMVCGVSWIPAGHYIQYHPKSNRACVACRIPLGITMQCAHPKCPKFFHPTCAAFADLLYHDGAPRTVCLETDTLRCIEHCP